MELILRRIAKKKGCKFYLGSDAHHPAPLDAARERFEAIVDALDLTEEDKFRPFG
jgi:histidinol phosphatase-like PHP family hydrolase